MDEELAVLARLQQAVEEDVDPEVVVGLFLAGRQATDEIRATVGQLEEELARSVSERRSEVDDLGQLVLYLLLGGIVLGGIAGLVAIRLFASGVTRRLDLLGTNVERFLEGEPFLPMPA
ncbi:hypothetical protein B7486_62260, partial [cyanobacterium TDX16]